MARLAVLLRGTAPVSDQTYDELGELAHLYRLDGERARYWADRYVSPLAAPPTIWQRLRLLNVTEALGLIAFAAALLAIPAVSALIQIASTHR